MNQIKQPINITACRYRPPLQSIGAYLPPPSG